MERRLEEIDGGVSAYEEASKRSRGVRIIGTDMCCTASLFRCSWRAIITEALRRASAGE